MEIILDTERLILREIQAEDDTALFELDSDPKVHEYLGRNPVKTIEQIQLVISYIRQQYMDNGIGRWAVIEKSSGNLIGWAGLKLIEEKVNGVENFYELGYRLMTKHWHKGFATEAAKAIVKYGFKELALEEIFAMTDPENVASKKVLEKSGFKFVESFDFNNEKTDWFRLSQA